MLYVLLGVALALLVSIGPLSWAAAPFDSLVETLVSSTDRLVSSLFSTVGLESYDPVLSAALAAVLSVFAPGMLAFILVSTSRASRDVRRKVAVLLLALSILSFFVLPATSALVLLVCSLFFAVLAGIFEGLIVTLPLVFFATFLGVRYGVLFWEGESVEVNSATAAVGALTGLETSGGLWHLVFSVCGLIPFVLTLKAALSSR